jgi:hypothetical protein
MTPGPGAASASNVRRLGACALRPYVPAADFETSLAFYSALGFSHDGIGPNLAAIRMGSIGFLLQGRCEDARAIGRQLNLQLIVDDIEAWWAHIGELEIRKRYGASAVRVDWLTNLGLAPIHLWDPAGVRWSLCAPLGDPPN